MPIVTLKCVCGKTFDDLQGNIVADNTTVCPSCGVKSGFEKVHGSVGRYQPGFYDRLTPIEMEIVMRHKKDMEEKESLRGEGYINIEEKGPNWARPFNNEPRRRFY